MLRYPLTVAICLLLTVAVAWLGRRLGRASRAERRLRAGLIGVALAGWLAYNGWYLWPSHYDGADSWPLHLCDVAAVVGPLALWTGWRWWRAALYFWTFGLSSQAFLTPVLDVGPEHMHYWLFWSNHTLVLMAGLYDVAVGRFRPTLADVWRAIGLTSVWFIVALSADWASRWQWNYGYLGPGRPDQPTLLDVLGPWPWRLVWVAGLTIIGFHLFWLPWAVARLKRPGRQQAPQ